MQNAPVEHSVVLWICMKLPHGFKTFVLSIFEWPYRALDHLNLGPKFGPNPNAKTYVFFPISDEKFPI